MKIISWNCKGKFREKFKEIIKEDADIYVICECENPACSESEEYKKFAGYNYAWLEITTLKVLEFLPKMILN